jgi:Tol biopolymer transport system component
VQRRSKRFVLAAALASMVIGVAPAAASPMGHGRDRTSSLIVFDTRYGAEVSQIFTVHPDGGGLRQLTHSADRGAWDPAFSPDGRRIAFVLDGPTGSSLWLMRTDGSDRHRVRPDAGHDDFAPAWTPNGSQIVFARCHQSPGYPCRIARMDADGTNLVELTRGFWHDGTGSFGSFPGELGPTLSPDGGRIAFASDRGGFDDRVFVIDANGSHLRAVSRPDFGAGSPSWSPDGRWIAVTGDPVNGTTFRMHPDGSGLHAVEPGALFATFSPSGRRLVGLAEASGRLATFSARGGPMTEISGTDGGTFSDWEVVR